MAGLPALSTGAGCNVKANSGKAETADSVNVIGIVTSAICRKRACTPVCLLLQRPKVTVSLLQAAALSISLSLSLTEAHYCFLQTHSVLFYTDGLTYSIVKYTHALIFMWSRCFRQENVTYYDLHLHSHRLFLLKLILRTYMSYRRVPN